MKCLSEMQKQIVAFIPRQWERGVMAQLGDTEDPSDRLRAVWIPEGGADGGWRRRSRGQVWQMYKIIT